MRAPGLLRGAPRGARLPDVSGDLLDQLALAFERALVAQAPPQLEYEPLAVQIAFEVEQERLDAPLLAAVVRVRPNRDRRARSMPETGVDAVCRHDQARVDCQVRRREAERPAPCVAGDDDALDLRGPAEQRGRPLHLAGADEPADMRRGDALDERHGPHLEAEAAQQLDVSAPSVAEAERLAGDDHLRPDRGEDVACEVLRLDPGDLERELDDERRLDPLLGDQLEAPLQRREHFHLVAERDPGVGIEGDDRRVQPGVDRRPQDPAVTGVDAVERADRDRARLPLELADGPGDPHSRASASSDGTIRCGSASSTENGPISVRRSVRQWPPRASAIART